MPGAVIGVDVASGKAALPPSTELLFQLETLLFGLPRDGPATPASPSELEGFLGPIEPADLTLDLCGDAPNAQGRIWRLLFDGVAGEAALFAILLEGRVPRAEIVESSSVIAAARIGTEFGGIALASFEHALARVSTLIVAAVRGGASPTLPVLPDEAEGPPEPIALGARTMAITAAKDVTRQVARQLYDLCYRSPHWRVGWRHFDGPDLFEVGDLANTSWHTLPDDGRRFYADPFPVTYRDEITLFVEDYQHEVGKGVISAVAFSADGPQGQPRPVLEQPGHLSYPFVFEREGQMWMIPESCSSRTVDLYRAADFPGGWTKEASLLSDVTASDATLVEHAGTWWLFATVRDGGGSYSDALHLWSARDFRGPWTPHARNPVLIDIASARPAGRMLRRNDILLRPVQDCRYGYGKALGIARVTRLDAEGFEQKIERILRPGPSWPGRRLHTLNSAGNLEFIDGSALSNRFVRRRAQKSGR